MLRSELVRELSARPDADVTVCIGGYLIDIVRVAHRADRDSVVVSLHPDDMREVLEIIAQHMLDRSE